jgi:hypothetical protein
MQAILELNQVSIQVMSSTICELPSPSAGASNGLTEFVARALLRRLPQAHPNPAATHADTHATAHRGPGCHRCSSGRAGASADLATGLAEAGDISAFRASVVNFEAFSAPKHFGCRWRDASAPAGPQNDRSARMRQPFCCVETPATLPLRTRRPVGRNPGLTQCRRRSPAGPGRCAHRQPG